MNGYNFALFNALTDALTALEEVKGILIKAQMSAEEHYLNSNPAKLLVIQSVGTSKDGTRHVPKASCNGNNEK